MSVFIPPKINDEQLSSIILEKGQIVYNESNDNFYTGNGELGGTKITKDVPTKTSDLTNDSGFITINDIPDISVEELDPVYTADKPNIALKSELPTKVSQLQNDSGFLSSIPENLVTEQELNNKGYLTSFTQSDPIYTADKPNLALKSELFSKSYNDLTDKPSIPSIDGLASEQYVDDKVATIEVPTKTSDLTNDSGFLSSIPENLVTEQELNDKGYLTSFTQSDPIYTADKPNIALKSELFSKSYNDLTDKPSIPSIDGLASEQYVDDKVATIEVPTKTSDLTNDSGFITADDIPSVEVTETDPIYTADKPNLALKSELFSKSYNDLTDKPEIFQPTTDGDGSKFLSDDGTYKTVQGGGSAGGSVDLSNYVTQGNINFTTTDANGNLTNKFSQQANYTQIGCAYTNLVELYGNYLRWYQKYNQSYPMYGVDFSSAAEFKLPINTTINGQQITANGSEMNEEWIYNNSANITTTNNLYLEVDYDRDYKLTDMTLNFDKVNNWMFHLITGDSFNYTINVNFNAFINKPFDFQPNKEYLIMSHKNIIIWNQIQRYNSGE